PACARGADRRCGPGQRGVRMVLGQESAEEGGIGPGVVEARERQSPPALEPSAWRPHRSDDGALARPTSPTEVLFREPVGAVPARLTRFAVSHRGVEDTETTGKENHASELPARQRTGRTGPLQRARLRRPSGRNPSSANSASAGHPSAPSPPAPPPPP